MPTEVVAIFTEELARQHPDKVFVYGDNLARRGRGGQAIIRFEENAFGVPTKRSSRMDSEALFADRDDERAAVLAALRVLFQLSRSRTLVFPQAGLGTGLAQMPQRSPGLYREMCSILREHFGFDQVDILPGLSLRSQRAGRPGIPTALGGFRRVVASVGSCC